MLNNGISLKTGQVQISFWDQTQTNTTKSANQSARSVGGERHMTLKHTLGFYHS